MLHVIYTYIRFVMKNLYRIAEYEREGRAQDKEDEYNKTDGIRTHVINSCYFKIFFKIFLKASLPNFLKALSLRLYPIVFLILFSSGFVM